MQGILHILDCIDRWLSRTVRFVATLLMAAIFVMFLLNVFVRFVPVHNFTQTDDWIQFCLIWMIFLGAEELVRIRGHFVVDFLAERITNMAAKRALTILVCAVELVTYALIAWFGFIWVMKSHAHMQAIPWMQVRWMYMALPVSATLMTLYATRDFLRVLCGLPRKPAEEDWEEKAEA